MKTQHLNEQDIIGRPCKVVYGRDGVTTGATVFVTSFDTSHKKVNAKLENSSTIVTFEEGDLELLPSSITEYKEIATNLEKELTQIQEKIDFMAQEGDENFSEEKFKLEKIAAKVIEAGGDPVKIKMAIAEYVL